LTSTLEKVSLADDPAGVAGAVSIEDDAGSEEQV
jgi:hypothetical protein